MNSVINKAIIDFLKGNCLIIKVITVHNQWVEIACL